MTKCAYNQIKIVLQEIKPQKWIFSILKKIILERDVSLLYQALMDLKYIVWIPLA